ncbi:ABC transporter ATP-binding protein [Alkalibacter rhizosphaerae]|uniref:Nickel import system ATP-binding protein NikD n=2 Tax=Alkalibacter rhizosphaerae TaxID=2815577 RepID=A0A974XGT5_9FIRM|nr:ABC transporter ATP-binding protein [Alkalibacter rhizosphaerae]
MLKVEDLSVSFVQYTKGLKQKDLKVITSLNIDIMPGEVLAVVGSSGSGKSLLAHAILGILPTNATVNGTMMYKGEALTTKRQQSLRGKEIALVPQSVKYLDPLMKVGKQVQSAVRKGDPVKAQKDVFARYHLKSGVDGQYPYQLSGGMSRRVLVSTAVVSGASLIIADEPTPGMDTAAVQESIRDLRKLADEGAAVMMITHDIDTALKIADRIAVFYAGTTVEVAPVSDFEGRGEKLRHPYSKALWRALPQNEFLPIEGFQPLPSALPPGCLFAPRCSMATPECSAGQPEARELRDGMVRCIHAT